MKLEYRRRYNSKYKLNTVPWEEYHNVLGFPISSIEWQIYVFRLNGKVYMSPTQEFKDEISKFIMWQKLNAI